MHGSLSSRIIGFILSLLLTVLALAIIIRPEFFHLLPKTAIHTIFALAILQAAIQSIFFLNIFGEKGPRWNLVVFASTVSIIFIIVVGSIWIMDHLNTNMKM